MIATAKLFKEFCGRVDLDIFSADEKKRAAALRNPGPVANQPVSKKKPQQKQNISMFSIEARLANGRNIQWSS